MKKIIGISLVFFLNCLILSAQSPLSGSYTIAPAGGDFSSFTEAIDSLKANGISSSVTFNAAAGTYEEPLEIDSIGGASETATISFIGEDVTTTIIQVSLSTNPAIQLSNCAYVQFQNLTISIAPNQGRPRNVMIQDGSKQISFKNCVFNGNGAVAHNIEIENAEAIQIDSCFIIETRLWNLYVKSSEQISIANSEFTSGLVFLITRGITLINNRVTTNNGWLRTAVGLSSCRDYHLEKNIVFSYPGSTSAVFIMEENTDDIGHHTIMPLLKNNAFSSAWIGGEIYPFDSIQMIHNTFIGGKIGIWLSENDSTPKQVQLENNLFAGIEEEAFFIKKPFDSLKLDYNAYSADTTNHPVLALVSDNGFDQFTNFSDYQLAFPNQDQHSHFVNLKYLAENDYHINSATEFHFGRNDLGITEDVEGDPRGLWGDAVDVGADEFAGYLTNVFEVRGRLFLDENGNGLQDDDEYGLANREISQLTDGISTFTDENGDYYFYTIDGNSYTIQPETLTGFLISPTDSTVIAGANHIDSINFAYQIVEQIPEIEIDFTTVFKRCFRTINGYISYENTGSVQDDFTISMTPAEDYVLESAEPNWDSEVDGTYYWEIEDLAIFESGLIRLQITMPGVDAIGVEQTTLLAATNEGSTLKEKTYVDEIACSYDPNDKAVYPAGFGDDNLVLKTDSLEYLIRFQNTGNDTAFDIRIQDQLSSELELNTFEFISASHEVRTELNETTNQLIFYFDDIQLVDSVANEPESHGYVKYRIKAKEDILDSTEILNTAYIYFDFNPPIITNTVSSMMVDELPGALVTALPSVSEMNLQIYPNPTDGLLNIQLPSSAPVFLKLMSLDGRVIHQHHYNKAEIRLDLHLLPVGIYIVKINGEDYQVHERIVIR